MAALVYTWRVLGNGVVNTFPFSDATGERQGKWVSAWLGGNKTIKSVIKPIITNRAENYQKRRKRKWGSCELQRQFLEARACYKLSRKNGWLCCISCVACDHHFSRFNKNSKKCHYCVNCENHIEIPKPIFIQMGIQWNLPILVKLVTKMWPKMLIGVKVIIIL